MKIIFYIILIAAAFQIQGQKFKCIYKETCKTEDGVYNYAYCFNQIPKEDQPTSLKYVEDEYGLEDKPIEEFVQSICDDSERSEEIFDSLLDQIFIPYENRYSDNRINARSYIAVQKCFLGIYETCKFKEDFGITY